MNSTIYIFILFFTTTNNAISMQILQNLLACRSFTKIAVIALTIIVLEYWTYPPIVYIQKTFG